MSGIERGRIKKFELRGMKGSKMADSRTPCFIAQSFSFKFEALNIIRRTNFILITLDNLGAASVRLFVVHSNLEPFRGGQGGYDRHVSIGPANMITSIDQTATTDKPSFIDLVGLLVKVDAEIPGIFGCRNGTGHDSLVDQ